MKYTEEAFTELFERLEAIKECKDIPLYTYDRAYEGLTIIRRIVGGECRVIEGADHDIIYSLNISKLVQYDIREEDIRKLVELGWMIQDEGLAHFV